MTPHEHFTKVLRGARASTAPLGLVTVLALRGRSRDGGIHSVRLTPTYDDTVAIVSPRRVLGVFSASTHPWQSGNEDALLRPGTYFGHPAELVGGRPSWRLLLNLKRPDDRRVPVWQGPEHRPETAEDIAVHAGETLPARGCQIVDPKQYDGFVAAVGGPTKSFQYVLVDLAAERGLS